MRYVTSSSGINQIKLFKFSDNRINVKFLEITHIPIFQVKIVKINLNC